MVYNSPNELLHALVQAYFQKRDIDIILSCVTEDIEWIGTEDDECATGKDNLRKILEEDIKSFPGAYGVTLKEPREQIISSDNVMLTVEGEQDNIPGFSSKLLVRGTVCCVKTEKGWMVNNVHTSVANALVSASLYKDAVDGSPSGVFVGEKGTRNSIYANKASIYIGEYASDTKVTGKSVVQFLEKYHQKPFLSQKEVDELSSDEYTQYHLERNGKHIAVKAKAITWNKRDSYIMYMTDETAGYLEQKRYRSLLEAMDIALFEWSPNNGFYATENYYRYAMAQEDYELVFTNQANHSLVHPDDHELLLKFFRDTEENRVKNTTTIRMKMTDGTYRWTELICFNEYDKYNNRIRIMGVLRDIDKARSDEVERLNAALEEAKKANAAKTEFLSRVSHDMRTPLNGIIGLTTLIKENVSDVSVLRDLRELELSSHYLLNLINDTLDVSRIENGKLELHPMIYEGRDVFNTCLKLIKPSIEEKHINLIVDNEAVSFTTLYVDANRIQQVVMNVLGNAVKFTPEGGTIHVTISNISTENGVIFDKIIIQDNGIGMSPEFIPHIFESYSQADTASTNTQNGTGLGMAITKQLVQLMGGDITVESELGKGSCFTITFKMNIANEEQIRQWKKEQSIAYDDSNLSGKRVLLCEDHPLNAQIATRLLESKGMLVEHAANGQIAVEMFENSERDYYNVILMDIRMPIMDGIEATKQIRSISGEDAKQIPIIAMTANAFADDSEKTSLAGMNAHLSKPIEKRSLFKTISSFLDVKEKTLRPKILVVDDAEVNRSVVVAALERDYEIFEAENGCQAMEILSDTRGINAVITDIQMPKMDGIELIRKIRADKKFKHVVIIANTQFGDPEQEERLLAIGANDFVYKPTTPKIVEIRVRNALNKI